jgi:hypothetical protein
MTTTADSKTISLNAVMGYTHPGLVERLQDKLTITEPEALELFNDMKRFLYLCSISEASLAPSPLIDEAWHHFILFTQDYAGFCDHYIGRFIHHYPKTRYERSSSDRSSALRTRELTLAVFGTDVSRNWGFNAPRTESANECEAPSPECGHGPPSTSCEDK